MKGIDIWSASLDRSSDEIGELWTLLDADEKSRAQKFHRDVDRARYIAARGTLRTIVGSYTSSSPRTVSFVVLSGGKPALSPSMGAEQLHFNVSHCGGFALFAFSDREVGIDVERVDDISDKSRIVSHFFSSHEARTFNKLNPAEQTRFFYRTWVRKEACLKATGEGFAVDPATLSVGESDDTSAVVYKPGKAGLSSTYQIMDIDEFGGHAAAIAFATNGTSPLIQFHEAQPLSDLAFD